MVVDPVNGFFLYVNQKQVPRVYMTLDEAQNEANPHIQVQSGLQIKTTGGSGSLVRIWNYRYDIKQWVEMMQG